jgi:ADP-heptose:LPS heptosyltransferase
VAPIGSGFGDVLISLPVVQALLDQGENVYLVTRSYRQEGIAPRIPGLRGEIREGDLQLAAGDRYINLRAHPIQTDYLWGTPEFEQIFGLTRIEKIITVIARDWDLTISFQDLKPLSYTQCPEIVGKIVFVPGTDGHFKHWPKAYWLDLKNSLEKRGQSVIVLGRPEESPAVKELIESGLPWLPTASAGDAIDAISSALAVVAVDTGLMHVALQQKIPTVSFVHPSMFHHRTAANSFQFIGQHCPPECGRDTVLPPGVTAASCLDVDLKFQYHVCPLGLASDCPPTGTGNAHFNCMSGIKPDAVLEQMEKQGVLKRTF